VLQRVWASKWLRPGLLLVILAFCCWGLDSEWPQVHPALGQLHWYSMVGSLLAAMAGSGCMMLAWRALLADLGSRLPVAVAARVTFVAQLGKYLPGSVWSFAAHVELGHDYGVPRRRGAASVIVALAVAIAAGLLIAAVALPLASPAVIRKYGLALLAAPVIVVCLAPPILHRILNRALRLIRQEPLEHPLSWRALGVALAWSVLGWLIFGAQVWVLLADVAKDGTHSMLLAVGAYALAYSLALLVFVLPNGIGARELLLVAALAPLLTHGPALAVALVTRVVTTGSDLLWGGLGIALGRAARRSAVGAGAGTDAHSRRHPGRHRKPTGRGPHSRPPVDTEHGGTPSLPEVAA
jgi:uncharacterized membrane protein YbhN (UPF0104 family)